jgi:hypothetical protein
MSQTSPFGQPVDDESSERPPVPTTPAPAEKSSRTALLAIGATAIALVAGVGGFFLLSGGSDEYPTGIDSSFPKAKAPATSPSPSTSPTPLPTESTVNARNPFVNPPTPTTAATSPAAVAPATTAPSAQSPQSAAEPAKVFVMLVTFDKQTKDAKFRVISPQESGKETWPVSRGEDFGMPFGTFPSMPFTYDGDSKTVSGTVCPTVKYVDAASVRVCKGEIVQVQ